MEHRRNDSDKGKPSDVNLSHSHTVHLKFHKNGLAQNGVILHVRTANNLFCHSMTEFFTSQE